MSDCPIRCCSFCGKQFEPHPRLGERQRTCGRADCQKQRRSLNTRHWRARHPDTDDALCRRGRQRDRRAYHRRYWALHPQRRRHHAAYMRQWRARRRASTLTCVNNPYRDNQAKLPAINTYLQVTSVNNANRVITVKWLSPQELVPDISCEQRESRWT